MYDIFYLSKSKHTDWEVFKQRFPSAQKIENVSSFEDVKKRAFTKFFWVVWDDVLVTGDFDFSYKVSKWDEEYIHVFKNNDYYDGISLVSKTVPVSNREFFTRHFINKKEIDVVASMPKPYEVCTLDTYEEYLAKIKSAKDDLFWNVPSDVLIGDFNFNIYFKHDNIYDRSTNHVFKNGEYYDGISLLSKHKELTEREFNARFPVERKEWDVQASVPRSFDIVFISYNEPNADENYNKLLSKFPRVKRVHGVKGIHQAHIAAAELSTTPMFWVVDADAEILDSFKFEIEHIPHYDTGNRKNFLKTVHVWRSINPINNLEYGYGGVKLLPKELTLNVDVRSSDMTTSISDSFKAMHEVSNVTKFNTDPFTTWRSAFRECVKLASKVIDRNYEEETDQRLVTWCSVGEDQEFGKYAIAGAKAGKVFGTKFLDIPEVLARINDFDWLEKEFKKVFSS